MKPSYFQDQNSVTHPKLKGIMGSEKEKEIFEKLQWEKNKILENDRLLATKNRAYRQRKQEN